MSSTVQTIEKKSSVKNGVGRLVLTAVSVILEAAVIIIIALRLNSYAEWIAIGTRILAALLVLAIYARNTTSAMKTPWIILIMTFPVLGVTLYLLIGFNGSTRSMRKRYEDIDRVLLPKLPENREVLESLQDKSGYLANIARYVQDKAGYPVYRNTDIVYYDDAAAALAAQKDIGEGASKYVIFCDGGYLEYPHRYFCVMTATATDTDDQRTFVREKAVLLESQPYREDWARRELSTDIQARNYLDELEEMIYDCSHASNFAVRDLMSEIKNGGGGTSNGIVYGIVNGVQNWFGGGDNFSQTGLNALSDEARARIQERMTSWQEMDDLEGRSAFDKLSPILSLIDVAKDGYDKHYGYDAMTINIIRYQIDETFSRHKRALYDVRQRML